MHKVGDEVRVFHPDFVGVVKVGFITKLENRNVVLRNGGFTHAHIDFGPVLGGVKCVTRRDIVEWADL